MTRELIASYYGTNSKAFISYDVPSESLYKRFDFSKTIHEKENKSTKFNRKKMFAVIEEIHDDYLILNCMLDEKTKITQKRKFDKTPFINKFELIEGEGVEITINTSPGRREFIYEKNDNSKLFFEEPEDLFSKFKGTTLFPNSK